MPVGVQTATTDISLRVMVPVLSVQITVVEPRVSTDSRRRTSACRPAMVCAARASDKSADPYGARPAAAVRPQQRPARRPRLRPRRERLGHHRRHGRTSVPARVAGNVANPRAQVITAAGEGSAAAIAINGDLVDEDVRVAVHDFTTGLV